MSTQTFAQSKIALLRSVTLRAALLVGGVLVLPLVGFVGTANAVSYSCPADALCVYEHANGGGLRTYWGGDWSGTCWNMIPSWNDRVSSIQNNMSKSATFHRDASCPAYDWEAFEVLQNQSSTTGDGNFPSAMNDTISSIHFN